MITKLEITMSILVKFFVMGRFTMIMRLKIQFKDEGGLYFTDNFGLFI